MKEGPRLPETLAGLVWDTVAQPLWSGLTWPEMCARSFSLQRQPGGAGNSSRCGWPSRGSWPCCSWGF